MNGGYPGNPDDVMFITVSIVDEQQFLLIGNAISSAEDVKKIIYDIMFCPCCTADIRISCPMGIVDGATVVVDEISD